MSTHNSLLPTTMNRTKVQSRATMLTPPSTPATIEVATPGRASHWWSRRGAGEAPRLNGVDRDPDLAAAHVFLRLR